VDLLYNNLYNKIHSESTTIVEQVEFGLKAATHGPTVPADI